QMNKTFDEPMNNDGVQTFHQITLSDNTVHYVTTCTSQAVFESLSDSSPVGRGAARKGGAYPGSMIARSNQMFTEGVDQGCDSSVASSLVGHSPQVVHVHLHAMSDSSGSPSGQVHLHTCHRGGHDIGVMSVGQIPTN